jgi:hypothetical protein
MPSLLSSHPSETWLSSSTLSDWEDISPRHAFNFHVKSSRNQKGGFPSDRFWADSTFCSILINYSVSCTEVNLVDGENGAGVGKRILSGSSPPGKEREW